MSWQVLLEHENECIAVHTRKDTTGACRPLRMGTKEGEQLGVPVITR